MSQLNFDTNHWLKPETKRVSLYVVYNKTREYNRKKERGIGIRIPRYAMYHYDFEEDVFECVLKYFRSQL